MVHWAWLPHAALSVRYVACLFPIGVIVTRACIVLQNKGQITLNAMGIGTSTESRESNHTTIPTTTNATPNEREQTGALSKLRKENKKETHATRDYKLEGHVHT